MKTCPICNKQNFGNERHCRWCGADIEESPKTDAEIIEESPKTDAEIAEISERIRRRRRRAELLKSLVSWIYLMVLILIMDFLPNREYKYGG